MPDGQCDEHPPQWPVLHGFHGELLVLGVKVAASTVWQILTDTGVDPAPERASSTWAQFLRSQAEVLLACDFFETVTLTGARMYVPHLFDAILADAGSQVVLSGIHMPRMNSIIERWIQTCRHELLDRTLIWNQRHLLHALRDYEQFYNSHRPHQGIANARPLRPLPQTITDSAQIGQLDIRRHQRLGGILNEYHHVA